MQLISDKRMMFKGIVILTSLLLVACQTAQQSTTQFQSKSVQQTAPLQLTAMPMAQKIEAAQWLNPAIFSASKTLSSADLIVASKKNGVQVLNAQGKTLSQFKGYFTTLDHRANADTLIVTSVNGDTQQAVVMALDSRTGTWAKPLAVTKPQFKIEDACLYQDRAQHTFVFLVGEEGLGEQWLVSEKTGLLPKALQVRSLSLPPASSFCRVDDTTHTLFVNEENVGLWAYAAHAEAELLRQPVAMLQPFGDIAKNASGMAVFDQEVLLLDASSNTLHRYQMIEQQYAPQGNAFDLNKLDSPEKISVRKHANGLEVLVHDENGLHRATIPHATQINAKLDASASHLKTYSIAEVKPAIQTDLMPSLGDAADDPAIWIHPTDARQSRVLGTDKQGGLAVYDLQGKELQYLAVGRLNNVDIRSGFNLNGTLIDLAVASNRDHNSLHLFSINRETGHLTTLGEQATTIQDMYGICMYKDTQQRFYAIVNDKDGTFEQHQLSVMDGQIIANKVRTFKVATQPEGCVVNDQTAQLFVGEEDEAVWALSADADAPVTMTKVIGTDAIVHADIEGIAYYQANPQNGTQKNYLVISSQGNDSYVVLEATPPYKLRGAFTIGINVALGIDGASETDGLEVTSADLSGNHTGPWRLGMLVVQDGRKRMPESRQNFKYVPWTAIADALNLE
ncbi:MAG: phytase [Methylophilus sp.]|nr:phytase [Methylophilus sp.]